MAIYGHFEKKMFLGNLGQHILFLKYFKQNGEKLATKKSLVQRDYSFFPQVNQKKTCETN
jgi:hypothetical protein